MATPIILFLTTLLTCAASWADGPATRPSPRVLFLVGEGFNAGEFWTPCLGLQAVGCRVTVAGVSRGTIPAGSKNRALDAVAELTLEEIDPAQFDALVIPGGYGPANLEKHPRAIETCRAFLSANDRKLAAAICHGPRLLAQTGLLRGRVATCLNTVKDELPELWRSGGFGVYLDLPVVIDGNLITSRYPNDAEAFTRAIARTLLPTASASEPQDGTVLIVNGDHPPLPAGMLGAVAAAGLKSRIGGESIIDAAAPDDTVVLLPGERLAGMFKDATRRSRLAALAERGRVIAVGVVPETLLDPGTRRVGFDHETPARAVAETLREVIETRRGNPAARPAEDARRTCLVAVSEGFDDRVVATMQAVLSARGFRVVLVSDASGWVRGQAGLPVLPELTFASAERLPRVDLVIAPGHVRPVDPERDGRYRDWLLRHESDGVPLVLFGFDALLVGNEPRFKGMKFASSDQAVWSFKGGADYSNEPATLSAPKLLTVKGADALPHALRLMDQLPRPGSAFDD